MSPNHHVDCFAELPVIRAPDQVFELDDLMAAARERVSEQDLQSLLEKKRGDRQMAD